MIRKNVKLLASISNFFIILWNLQSRLFFLDKKSFPSLYFKPRIAPISAQEANENTAQLSRFLLTFNDSTLATGVHNLKSNLPTFALTNFADLQVNIHQSLRWVNVPGSTNRLMAFSVVEVISRMFFYKNVLVQFLWFSNLHKQHKFKNDSNNNCVSCLDLVLFWKFLSEDVVLKLKKFCPHQCANSWPRAQHLNVQSLV